MSSQRLHTLLAQATILPMAALALVGWIALFADLQWSRLWLVPLGWAIYVVEEHLVHRFIFHMPAPSNQWMFDRLYRLHYGHHDQPAKLDILVTPLWFAMPFAILNCAASAVVFWSVRDAMVATFAGGVTAYLAYEWFHMACHDGGPASAFTRRRKAWHMQHHFLDHAARFTVSPGGSWVDALLGRAVSRRPSGDAVQQVRTLGLDRDDPRLQRARRV